VATEIIIETDGGTVVVPHDATSVRAARNVIVSPAVLGTQDVQAALEALAEGGGGGGGGGSGDGAPIGAQYVVLAANPTLTNERVLTAGSGVTVTDAGTNGGTVTISAAVQSVAGKTGVVSLTKGDVGLGDVDNTTDLAKPISAATQAALDGKAAASHTHTASAITNFAEAVEAELLTLLPTDGGVLDIAQESTLVAALSAIDGIDGRVTAIENAGFSAVEYLTDFFDEDDLPATPGESPGVLTWTPDEGSGPYGWTVAPVIAAPPAFINGGDANADEAEI